MRHRNNVNQIQTSHSVNKNVLYESNIGIDKRKNKCTGIYFERENIRADERYKYLCSHYLQYYSIVFLNAIR